ncbi:nucleotidyltransferase family protein [Streptomyces sp. NPDC093600]|uniref:nucleotidyltransferase family protein n=1 Tax=Streptomyces sp. NPDC093600 TaxID=3366047 RepID=UPI00382FF252
MNLMEGPARNNAIRTGSHDTASDPNRLSAAAPAPAGSRGRDRAGGAPESLPPDHTQAILETTKQVAALLKKSGCPFALVGSVAVYAHGIPVRLQHDTDFAVRREDAEAVVRILEENGIEIIEPPEDWLVKARTRGEQIDLIFSLADRPVTTELLDRAQQLPVDSVHMPVLAPTDLVSSRLAALSEHHCDFGALLPVARGLRERVDWDRVRREHGDAPMPDAFLYLLERLDVIPGREATDEGR